jgi:hypothetical protein
MPRPGVLTEPGRALGSLLPGVLAGQPAPAERTPREQPEPVLLAGRDDLQLGLADQQAVRGLQGDRHGQVVALGQVDRLLHLPAGEVRQAGVADLPRRDGVVEEPQRLLQRRVRVPGVQLVEVDVLDPEPAQRRVECSAEVAP